LTDNQRSHSKISSDIMGYRDYRGVPVFGAWSWGNRLQIGLTAEIDVDEALSHYYQTRLMVIGILSFVLFLSIGAVLLVLVLGERASKTLRTSKDNLENEVEKRTAELQLNQERLKVAEERSRLLLNSAGEGIFGVDLEGKINFVNHTALTMLGYTEEDEMIGKSTHPLIHHSHMDGTHYDVKDCPMYHSFSYGKSGKITDEVLWRKDGSCFDVEYSSTPIRKDNQILGAVITFLDVTERKQAELESKQKHEQLVRLIEEMPIPAAYFDPNGDVRFINQAFIGLVGYTREDIPNVEAHWPLFYPDAEYREQIKADWTGRVEESAKTGIPIEPMLLNINTKSGDRKTLLAHTIQIGELALTMWIDFTERERFENELSSAKEAAERVIDFSPIPIGIIDIDTLEVIKVNKALLDFHTIESLEVYEPDKLYVDPDKDRTRILEEYKKVGRVKDVEVQHRRMGTGESVWILLSLYPINYMGKNCTITSFIDLSDQKQVEEMLLAEKTHLQKIFDTSPVGVGISSDGIMRFANPRMLETLNIKMDSSGPNTYVNLEDREHIMKTLDKQGVIKNYELQMYGPHDEIRDILMTYIKIDYEGKDSILGWAIDITELKKTDQELRQKFDELSRFRKLAVGRENKMVEIKNEINALLIKANQSPKYKIVKRDH